MLSVVSAVSRFTTVLFARNLRGCSGLDGGLDGRLDSGFGRCGEFGRSSCGDGITQLAQTIHSGVGTHIQQANDDAHQLITNGLRNAFTTASGQVNYPVQMAAVAIVSAPLFLVFIFLRKYIMAGVSRSGIKG